LATCRGPVMVTDPTPHRPTAARILETLKLPRLTHESAGILSGGQMKPLELDRMMRSGPKIGILDEIGAGVHPNLKNAIADNIRHYQSRGVAFLLIEHDMDFIQDVCEDIVEIGRAHV